MIPVYAVAVVLGFLGALAWVTLGLTAAAVEGKDDLDPEARYGSAGRYVVAGVLGFGLGGMSASYGGWAEWAAVAAAVGGGLLAIAAARFLGVDEEPDEDTA